MGTGRKTPRLGRLVCTAGGRAESCFPIFERTPRPTQRSRSNRRSPNEPPLLRENTPKGSRTPVGKLASRFAASTYGGGRRRLGALLGATGPGLAGIGAPDPEVAQAALCHPREYRADRRGRSFPEAPACYGSYLSSTTGESIAVAHAGSHRPTPPIPRPNAARGTEWLHPTRHGTPCQRITEPATLNCPRPPRGFHNLTGR